MRAAGWFVALGVVWVIGCSGISQAAIADTVEDFYKGRNVEMLVGAVPGEAVHSIACR